MLDHSCNNNRKIAKSKGGKETYSLLTAQLVVDCSFRQGTAAGVVCRCESDGTSAQLCKVKTETLLKGSSTKVWKNLILTHTAANLQAHQEMP